MVLGEEPSHHLMPGRCKLLSHPECEVGKYVSLLYGLLTVEATGVTLALSHNVMFYAHNFTSLCVDVPHRTHVHSE